MSPAISKVSFALVVILFAIGLIYLFAAFPVQAVLYVVAAIAGAIFFAALIWIFSRKEGMA